jgi:hypothetical protein
MIGGSRAVGTLQDLQGTDFPKEIRSQAASFLNELGGRIEDPMLGSERTPRSAEEVRRRDSLDDPYQWRPAAEGLRDYLLCVGRRCLEEHADAPRSVLVVKEAEAVSSAFRDGPAVASWQADLLNAIEPVVPQFMIRFASCEVLALDPVVRFFPSSDVDGLTKLRTPRDWSRLGLVPGSRSASHLDQLPLFDPGERDVSDDLHVRGLLRDWLSVPLHLARLFGRRKHYPLVFSMAAFTYSMYRELEFTRAVPFPELLRSAFRGALSPQS